MSKTQFNQEMGIMLTGAATGAGIGSFLFSAISTFFLGILGAAGGWVFIHWIQPKLAKLFKKKESKA